MAPCLGEVLYGSVQTAPGLFDGRHVPVDGAGLQGVPPCRPAAAETAHTELGLPAAGPVSGATFRADSAETGDKPCIQTGELFRPASPRLWT